MFADACNDSPARAPSVTAVGAVQLGDGMASFSNGGSCIDIMAPGVNVISAAPGSPSATACAAELLHASLLLLPHAACDTLTLQQATVSVHVIMQPFLVLVSMHTASVKNARQDDAPHWSAQEMCCAG